MRWFATFILIAGLLGMAGCGIGEDSRSSSATGADAGVCVRDLPAIQELLTHPRACASASQCPAGTFCDLERGACDWECTQDADCGPGVVCGCDGACLRAGRPDGGPSRRSCDRDPTVLQTLKTTVRTCVFDEECPQGAHCADATRTCDYACLADAQCGAGEVCDCFGRCAKVGVEAPTPADRVVRLDLSPARNPVIEVNGGASPWKARRLEVAVRAPDQDSAAQVAGADVHVKASDGLLVACDDSGQTAPAASAFRSACDLKNTWTFQTVGLQRHALKYVWVLPAAPTGNPPKYATSGDVTVTSDALEGSPASAQFAPALGPVDGPPPGTPYPFEGEYSGTVTFLGVTSLAEVDPAPPAVPTTIPVQAWAGSAAAANTVDLYDATQTLSPSGKVRLGPDGTSAGMDWLGLGALTVTVEAGTRSFDPLSGTLRGDFRVRFRFANEGVLVITHYRYELHPLKPLTPCSAGCPRGTTCDSTLGGGVCEAGPVWTPGSPAGNSGGMSEQALEWGTWIGALAERTITGGDQTPFGYPSFFLDDLYDGAAGWARDSGKPMPAVNSNGMLWLSTAHSYENGLPVCRDDFWSYFHWIDGAKINGQALRAYLTDDDAGGGATKPSVDQACLDFYQYTPECLDGDGRHCNIVRSPPEPVLSETARDYAPCIDPAPVAGGTDWFGSLPSEKRGSCRKVYTNWKAATGSTLTENQFLSQTCYDTWEVLRLGKESDGIGSYTQYRIRLCPFKPQMLGPTDAYTEAMRYACYDRDQRPGGQLETAYFVSSPALPVSGDLACEGDRIPHGADLVFDADRAAAEGSSPTGAAEMLQACLEDLIELPSQSWLQGSGERKLTNALDRTFADRTCFSAARFYGTLYPYYPVPGENDPKWQRLYLRFLSQWLAVHGFLAKEMTQAQGIAAAVAAGLDIDPADHAATASTPDPLEVIAQLERGWTEVLSFNASDRLAKMSRDVLRSPDYRTTGSPSDDQQAGLSALVLETAALHADLISSHLRRVQRESEGECRLTGSSSTIRTALQTTGHLMRSLTAAEALAVSLYDRSTAKTCAAANECGAGGTCVTGRCVKDRALVRDAGPVVWQSRWDAAQAQYQAARQRATELAADLSACKLPGGLPEGAVPLYFGDPSGTSSRFSASSDYLLSDWAKPAVAQARNALDAARGAWTQQRDSAIQQVLTQHDADRRREAIAQEYGQRLIDLCGLQDVPAKDALAQLTGPEDADTCFIDRSNGSCRQFIGASRSSPRVALGPEADPPADARVTEPEARYRLCLWKELRFQIGLRPDLIALADNYRTATVTTDSRGPIVSAGNAWVSTKALFATPLTGAPADRLDRARATCTDSLGGKGDELPTSEEVVPDLTSHAACFRGQIGEQFLAVTGAQKDVDLSIMDWKDAEERYDIAANRCIKLKDWKADEDALARAHLKTMDGQRRARFAFSSLSQFMSSVTPWGAGGAILGAWAGMKQDRMETAESSYQENLRLIAKERELYDCYAEARAAKLSIDNAASAIERVVIDADRHMVALANLKAAVRNTLAEGQAALAREQGRRVPHIAFHYWLDEKIDRFHKDFDWARSLTYLAMLAVEFEYQQSLPLRDEILKATHPDQLADAIRAMEQVQLSRTINGRRPEEDTIVLSLRDDILDLDDLELAKPGERSWTAQQRFQHRLWSPEYAVYGPDGTYLGQGIPFTLGPEGELEYTCAERVWQVSATVQGDLLGQVAPNAPLMLRKHNHFASQWCDGKGDETSYQTGSVQPPSQLFHPEDRGGDEAAVNAFVTAHLRPWFNVPRSELYREAYAEGASEELAGRGLYGEYMLLFPAAGLLRDGFPLEQVEDVLLRFDYLAVDDVAGFRP